jgi:peptidoglycan/LPS O-acetylase OafA/YrhL
MTWLITLPCWLLGCRLAEVDWKSVVRSHEIWAWRFLIWMVSVGLLLLNFHSRATYTYTLPAFAVLVYVWLEREIGYYGSRKPPRFLEWAGTWSYSVYLVHMPVLEWIRAKGGKADFLTWFLTILGAIFAAYLFSLVFEAPSIRLIKKLKAKYPL